MEVRREGEKKNHIVEVQTILTYINQVSLPLSAMMGLGGHSLLLWLHQVEVMCGGLRRGTLL